MKVEAVKLIKCINENCGNAKNCARFKPSVELFVGVYSPCDCETCTLFVERVPNETKSTKL